MSLQRKSQHAKIIKLHYGLHIISNQDGTIKAFAENFWQRDELS